VLCSLLWVTLLGQGVGLGDPQRALPTPVMLGFWDSVNTGSSGGISHRAAARARARMGVPVVGWVLNGDCGTPKSPGDEVFWPLLTATIPPGIGEAGVDLVTPESLHWGGEDKSVTGEHVIKNI